MKPDSARNRRDTVFVARMVVLALIHLDHAAAMVAERTRQRYAVLADGYDPEVSAKFERISSAQANVAGIMHWLDKTEGA